MLLAAPGWPSLPRFLAASLGISGSVEFHGRLTPGELEALYATCHVFALLPLAALALIGYAAWGTLFAALALVGVVLNQVLFLLGVARTTAVHANILITMIPVFTLAVALVLGRERISARWTFRA